MNKPLLRYLFMTFLMVCATALSAINKEGGYFAGTLLAVFFIGFLGEIADE
jgi:uncharacterized membrane protein YczE